MKVYKIIFVFLLVLISGFSSACSVEDLLENTGKYGTFRLGLKNIENHIDKLELMESLYKKATVGGEIGCFQFTTKLTLNDNIDKVIEDVKVTYVVNINVVFYDKAGNRQTKKWENLELSFVVESGDKAVSGALETVTAEEGEKFGTSKVIINIFYADASNCISAMLEPLYIKNAQGKIFIDRPADQEASSAVAA